MAIVADKSGVNPTDRPYCTRNRVSAASPNTVLTPAYVGEIVFDTTNKVRWKADGITNADWRPMEAEVT
jgi:hypothetical protein